MFIKVDEQGFTINSVYKVSYAEILSEINISENDIVYLSGSLIEGYIDECSKGMGNPLSDMDVFIIRQHVDNINTNFEFIEGISKTYFRTINGINLDVEVIDTDTVDRITDALLRLNLKQEQNVMSMLSSGLPKGCDFQHINSFLNRIFYSICIYNEVGYKQVKSALKFDKFLALKSLHLSNITESILQDVRGNLVAGQADASLYSIRFAITYIMEIALSLYGVFVDREKWVALKFINLAQTNPVYDNLLALYNNMFKGDMSSDSHTLAKINDSLEKAKTELEQLFLKGLEI